MGWLRRLEPLDWIVAGAALVSLAVLGLEVRRVQRATAAIWDDAADDET